MGNLHKWFGGVHALDDAHMTIRKPGVVHALLGQNGSGKSTLLNVLSGQLRPDSGTIELDGREVSFRSPPDALAQGISMVSQETALAEHLSIAENILLGRRLVRGPTGIDWPASRVKAGEILARLGVQYDPGRLVSSLRPDQKQMVEIARALSTDVRILVLDEPTSSLTDEEVQWLFAAIRRLKERDVCVLYVSHRLPEIFAVCDEVTVLRDGVTVAEGPITDFTPTTIVDAMVGSARARGTRMGGTAPTGAPLLEIQNLSVAGSLSDACLEVREGEIVGLAGLEGSGRRELIEVVFGLRPRTSGTILLAGAQYSSNNPRDAIKQGIGFVPPDRKVEGVILPMTVQDNLGLPATSEFFRLLDPRRGAVRSDSAKVAQMLSIKAELDAPARTLSGGNQQKVVLGKWMVRPPRLLLLDEPTRGVDVAAKEEIHRQLREAASRGIAMLVSSSEYDELLEMCDRILVLFRGRIVADLRSEEATEIRIAALAGGANEQVTSAHTEVGS
jgi:ribose transport system ATP-binding protein/rhamnose transport system ATP-binding protein